MRALDGSLKEIGWLADWPGFNVPAGEITAGVPWSGRSGATWRERDTAQDFSILGGLDDGELLARGSGRARIGQEVGDGDQEIRIGSLVGIVADGRCGGPNCRGSIRVDAARDVAEAGSGGV